MDENGKAITDNDIKINGKLAGKSFELLRNDKNNKYKGNVEVLRKYNSELFNEKDFKLSDLLIKGEVESKSGEKISNGKVKVTYC